MAISFGDNTAIEVGGNVVGENMVSGNMTTVYGQADMKWRDTLLGEIAKDKTLPEPQKAAMVSMLDKIGEEIQKSAPSPTTIEHLLNTALAMKGDIAEVALATLASPLAGIGLVIKKVADKYKIERQAKETK